MVPADQGSTIADVGDEAEGRVGVTQCGFAPSAVERGAETAHRGGELPELAAAEARASAAEAKVSDAQAQIAALTLMIEKLRRALYEVVPGNWTAG